jgi:tetratricopeptide (TPR) repeat protein
MKTTLFFPLFILTSLSAIAQGNTIDSLQKVMALQADDTNKVKTLKNLYMAYWGKNSHDSSTILANRALALSEKLNYKPGQADALRMIGVIDRISGNYASALEADFKALSYYETLNDKKGIATELGNIGLVFWNQNNFGKALNYDFRSLAMYQAMKDKPGTARLLANIGIVYADSRKYAEALDFDKKALALDKELGNKAGIAAIVTDIGNMYTYMDSTSKALDYHTLAIQLDKEIGDNYGVLRSIGNIGCTYITMKNYKLAKVYIDSSLKLSLAAGAKENTRNMYSWLIIIDTNLKDFKAGYLDYKNFTAYRDSFDNAENVKKTVQAELGFEFEQKQAAQKAEQDKKDAIEQADITRRYIFIGAISLGLVLVAIFSVVLFSRFRITQRQKEIIEEQKVLVEEKNKDILDSITYAKRLQDAILPPLNLLQKQFPDSFVLYKPKDIVAGDFYWMHTHLQPLSMDREGKRHDSDKEVSTLIAACDCTGHGVPGAMVSVVCSNALNRAVKEFGLTDPGKILDKTRELVLETFEKSESNVQDGMDISLASITIPSVISAAKRLPRPDDGSRSDDSVRLQWAGAYNSLWYIVDGKLMEVIADKQPIGKTDNPKPFTTHTITLNPPSEEREAATIYLFTDGYADQFGGDKGKKFKYKQLQELLIANCHLPMEEQKQLLDKVFEAWKGNLEQTDDVCIIGIRI